jgi:hypothetical protein
MARRKLVWLRGKRCIDKSTLRYKPIDQDGSCNWAPQIVNEVATDRSRPDASLHDG